MYSVGKFCWVEGCRTENKTKQNTFYLNKDLNDKGNLTEYRDKRYGGQGKKRNYRLKE